MINYISNLIIPFIVLGVIVYAVIKKVNVYDAFLDGAKESLDVTLSIFPSLIAMVLGINIFLKSGVLECIFTLFKPLLSLLEVPMEIITLCIMRPISGSSSLALLNSIYEVFGPDGKIGILASIIQGSTETTFYILTLYFGSIGIKKIRYAMWAGLLADLIGIIASFIIISFLF